MAKPDFNEVLWFGLTTRDLALSWLSATAPKFRPYGLKMLELATVTSASQEFIRSIGVMVFATPEYHKPCLWTTVWRWLLFGISTRSATGAA